MFPPGVRFLFPLGVRFLLAMGGRCLFPAGGHEKSRSDFSFQPPRSREPHKFLKTINI
ncbi:hypothetical protein [Methanimicrococcus hongohii]|uniref:hypothetical protein n=1 Tax=Methanimicrococcus hongohii TaxID=3028295 RepID=UPI0029310640|nr:hypothetical protein [Methanimicrococcus sp. Hf6]